MENLDAVENLDSLGDHNAVDNWQAVDPTYRKILRLHLLIQSLFAISAITFFIWIIQEDVRLFLFALLGIYLLVLIWLLFIWAPKTAKRLQYALREDDINVQRGFLYWRQVSVACNRIQHLEVSQGPLERYFGLAKLKIYTAGTLGSDMSLPGVKLETAQQIKSILLKKINAEEMDDESL